MPKTLRPRIDWPQRWKREYMGVNTYWIKVSKCRRFRIAKLNRTKLFLCVRKPSATGGFWDNLSTHKIWETAVIAAVDYAAEHPEG